MATLEKRYPEKEIKSTEPSIEEQSRSLGNIVTNEEFQSILEDY